MVLLFLFVAALQTALIYYQHFSPFERESNLRALLCGAKPAPRYWAVLALDVCTGVLLWVLLLGVLPAPPGDVLPFFGGIAPLVRFAQTLPIWIIVSLLAAVLYSYINNTII